jgi:carboxylesterase type B
MLFSSLATHAAPTANTTLGPLVGATEHVGTTVVNVFRGVPFAASTGGANRWRPPQPRAPWSAPRPATANGPGCIQPHHNADVRRAPLRPPRFACPGVPRALCPS